MAKTTDSKPKFKRTCIMTTTVLYNTTCKACEIIKLGLVTAAMAIWAFGESAGRARAATELARQGYHKEARNLMIGNNDV